MTRAVAIAIAIAAPAVAQPPAPRDAGDIVVTGRALRTTAEIKRAIRHAAPSHNGQIARMDTRWRSVLCADVVGIAAPYDAIIAKRMNTDATDLLGKPVAPHCTPNVRLLFVEDGAALVRTAARAKDRSAVFGLAGDADIRRAVAERGPARAWTIIGERDVNGAALSDVNVQSIASYLRLPTSQAIEAVVVMIDRAGAAGKTIGQLADYAAMRALTGASPAGMTGADSILTLFDAPSPPAKLTTFDRSYIRALYAGDGNMLDSVQINAMARRMAKDQGADR